MDLIEIEYMALAPVFAVFGATFVLAGLMLRGGEKKRTKKVT